MKKRGQAALEYLFTYGYAFLAILITLGVLTYFGFLNFNSLKSQECSIIPGAECEEFTIRPVGAAGEVALQIRNTFGTDIEFLNMNITTDRQNAPILCVPSSGPFPALVPEEASEEFTCPIPANLYIKGDFYEFILHFKFIQPGHTYEHDVTGLINGLSQ